MKNTFKNPEDNLYLLAFLDAIDRIDILLLEIRHLQNTIIYSLREPTLYLPLRYEEPYLFADKWDNIFNGKLSNENYAAYVNKFIIRYPLSYHAVSFYTKETNKHEDIEPIIADLTEECEKIHYRLWYRVGQIWMGDNWVRDLRRQYHVLSALQILKQQIFQDKLFLCATALQANLFIRPNLTAKLDKSAFMILRQGVFRRLGKYIHILKNHKQQISQAVDFGISDDPRPSVERRLDMGIFMDFLANRTRDIHRDLNHLYHFIEGENNSENISLIFHGWSQSPQVNNVQLDDHVSNLLDPFGTKDHKDTVDYKRTYVKHLGYIDTSFWSPDRPDLQPIIAREIANNIVRNQLDNLTDEKLSNADGDFTQLIVDLRREISLMIKDSPQIKRLLEGKEHQLLKNIACDLLAASVKGVPYLYAQFLNDIAVGLENQLYVTDSINLDMVNFLQQGTATIEQAETWYLRLRLVAAWVEYSAHVELNALDYIVIEGVEDVTKNLLAFISKYTPATRQPVEHLWERLTGRLINEMIHSSAIEKTQKWRAKRAKNDAYKNKSTQFDKSEFPLATRGLNIHLQNYLFRLLLQHKTIKNKLPCAASSDLEHEFEKLYKLSIESISIPHRQESLRHPRHLFHYIYDIPFQASVLRSIDFIKRPSRYEDIFDEVHNDIQFGRNFFSLALEFYTRETESPEQRLNLCINLISHTYGRMKDPQLKTDSIWYPLLMWLSGNKQDPVDSIKKIINSDYSNIQNNVNNISATKISIFFAENKTVNIKTQRKLEKLAGHKINALQEILTSDEAINNGIFMPLLQFLSIRKNIKKEGAKYIKGESVHHFYRILLESLGDINYKPITDQNIEHQDLPHIPNIVMVSRLLFSNAYPVTDPLNEKKNQNSYLNSLPLEKTGRQQVWKNDAEQEKAFSTLGRYDAMVFNQTNFLFKCKIQHFQPKKSGVVSDEKFIPHFTRREMGIQLKILHSSAIEKNSSTDNHFAMIGVTLQRRSMRLGLLYRLLRVQKKTIETKYYSKLEKTLSDLENKINLDAYLTDGWGDIIFCFSTIKSHPLSKKHIDDVYTFQKYLYQNFMVDRTEVIFTPQCLDYTLSSPRYRVIILTRMLEDRWLMESVQNHIDTLRERLKTPPKGIKEVKMAMTPGRTDFSFHFIGDDSDPLTPVVDSYQHIIRWFEGESSHDKNLIKYLDKIETYIEPLIKN